MSRMHFENFSYAFSTGSEIDTMELSGKVLYARNHEPVQGVIVGGTFRGEWGGS